MSFTEESRRERENVCVWLCERESGFPIHLLRVISILWSAVLKMKKFNIRKVLDGLKEVSSSAPSVQVGPQENHLIQETLQSEHFQLCKVGEILL